MNAHIFYFIYIYILVGQDSTGLAGLLVQARDPAGQEILTHAQHITAPFGNAAAAAFPKNLNFFFC